MSRDTISVAHLKETSLFKCCKRLAHTLFWSMYASPVTVTFQYTWEIIEWDEYFKIPIEKTKVKIYLEKWPGTCFIYCNFIFAFVTSNYLWQEILSSFKCPFWCLFQFRKSKKKYTITEENIELIVQVDDKRYAYWHHQSRAHMTYFPIIPFPFLEYDLQSYYVVKLGFVFSVPDDLFELIMFLYQ